MNFGFAADEVCSLDLEQFDLAVETANYVYMRQNRETMLRDHTAAQGDQKAIKAAIKTYTKRGDRPLGTKTEADFLRFAGKGI